MNPGRETDPELAAQLAKVERTPTDDPAYPALLQEATEDRGHQVPQHLPLHRAAP